MHPILNVPTFDHAEMKAQKVKAVPVSKPTADETAIFRNSLSPNEIVKDFPGITTVQELIQNSVTKFGDLPFLGTRYKTLVKGQPVWSDYQYKTYSQVGNF